MKIVFLFCEDSLDDVPMGTTVFEFDIREQLKDASVAMISK